MSDSERTAELEQELRLSARSKSHFAKVAEYRAGSNAFERFVLSHHFEAIIALAIVCNAAVLCSEAQYQGMEIGATLDPNPESFVGAAESWPHAEEVYRILDWIFGIIFTGEMLVKVAATRSFYLRSPWNHIDVLVVLFFWIEVFSNTATMRRTTFIRICRLARVGRFVRIIKSIEGFDTLFVMTESLRASAKVFVWNVLLFVTTELFIGMVIFTFLYEFYFRDEAKPLEERQECYIYFGTFTRTMFSMFELLLANWPPISRTLAENVSHWFFLLMVLHKLTVGFVMVGVVNGVLMQETFKTAATDDTIMVAQKNRMIRLHTKKMHKLFEIADTSGDQQLDLLEFRAVMQNDTMKTWLMSMDIEVKEVDKVFEFIDDGSGTISVEELLDGIPKVKGYARSIDMQVLMKSLRELDGRVQALAARHGFDDRVRGSEANPDFDEARNSVASRDPDTSKARKFDQLSI